MFCYEYLGFTLTPVLDPSHPLRYRLQAAHFQALRMRSLPHGTGGLPVDVLSMMYGGTVAPHLEIGPGLWAPPHHGGFSDYATPVVPPRTDGGSSSIANPFEEAVKLQRRCASHVLGLCSKSRRSSQYTTTALLFSELGWTHLPSRWDVARLRMLGNVLRSPPDSLMRAVACHLASAAGNVSDPLQRRRVAWNWAAVTADLVAGIDKEVGAPEQLGPQFNFKKMLPVKEDKCAPVLVGDVPAFDLDWRLAAYEAVNGESGRDAAWWKKNLDDRAKAYAAAVRAPAVPLGDSLKDRVCDPGVQGGGVRAKDGPATCGTTSTAAFTAALTQLNGAASFGRGAMSPYLRCGPPNQTMRARLELRAGIQSSWRCPRLRQDSAAGESAGDGGEAAAVATLNSSGCMWGSTTCQSCAGGVTLDAWHRLSECLTLDGTRAESFAAAVQRAKDWGQRHPDKEKNAATVVKVLTEVDALRGTRPYRVFTFLAALAAPVSFDACAGIPQAWANLLCVDRGSASMQGASVAISVVFPAFAPLAAQAAKGIQRQAQGVPAGED